MRALTVALNAIKSPAVRRFMLAAGRLVRANLGRLAVGLKALGRTLFKSSPVLAELAFVGAKGVVSTGATVVGVIAQTTPGIISFIVSIVGLIIYTVLLPLFFHAKKHASLRRVLLVVGFLGMAGGAGGVYYLASNKEVVATLDVNKAEKTKATLVETLSPAGMARLFTSLAKKGADEAEKKVAKWN
jgi:hypothetical protein